MKPAPALLLLALAAALMLPVSPAYAQIELAQADPPDGAELSEPPQVVRLCFSQPIKDDFNLSYRLPDGYLSAMSIAFVPGSRCVTVAPLLPDDAPPGEYTLDWRVTAAEADEQASGTLQFQVTRSTRATPAPSPTPGGTPAPSASPAPGETPPPTTPAAGGGPETVEEGDDDGPDILFLALITTASVGGAAVLFTLGHLLRRRIGYEPHRPPEGDEESEGH
jgi:methionine-rich copper-binding protein CopC